MLHRLVWTALLLTSVSAAPAAAVDTLRIGDATLRVPAPEGLRRLDGRSEAFDTRLQDLPPKTNRVAAYYGPGRDLSDLLSEVEPGLGRTASVQVPRSFEEVSLSPEDFQTYKGYLRENFGRLLPRYRELTQALSSRPAAEVLGPSFFLAPGELIPFGFDPETDRSISFTVLSGTYWPARPDSSGDTGLSVSSASALLIEGKVVYLYATARYADGADADWTRATVAGWRDRVAELNP
jgi:hypothetical protein